MNKKQYGRIITLDYDDGLYEYVANEAIELVKRDIREEIEVDENSWNVTTRKNYKTGFMDIYIKCYCTGK